MPRSRAPEAGSVLKSPAANMASDSPARETLPPSAVRKASNAMPFAVRANDHAGTQLRTLRVL
jgi:hypothetical protein